LYRFIFILTKHTTLPIYHQYSIYNYIVTIICLYIVDCVGVVMDETRRVVDKIARWFHLPWRCARSCAFGVHGTAARRAARKLLGSWAADVTSRAVCAHNTTHPHTRLPPTAHFVSRGRARTARVSVHFIWQTVVRACVGSSYLFWGYDIRVLQLVVVTTTSSCY